MSSNGYQCFGEVYGHPTGNPFIGCPHQPQAEAPLSEHQRKHQQALEPEPISMIDEEEFARKFRDIALFADQDDVEEDAALLHATLGSRRKSDQYIYNKSSYTDDRNAGFNSKLIDTSKLASVMPTPRADRLTRAPGSGSGSHPSTPSFGSSLGGKSFLDDDWLLNRVEHDSNMAQVAAGLVRPRSAMSRPRTPIQSNGGSFAFRSLNDSKKGSPGAGDRHAEPIPPPSDYICKLCNIAGHWLKDCHLFEPRQSYSGNGKGTFGSMRPGSTTNGRTPKPPSNYICRLCGVSGHWIEHCQMFQPKQPQTSLAVSVKESAANAAASIDGKRTMSHPSFRSIPPPPGYVCNLCEQPGHWLQQCSRFEPMSSACALKSSQRGGRKERR